MFGFGNSAPEKKVMKSVKLVKQTGSAVSLEKVEQAGGIDLRKKTEAAGTALSMKGLAGIRAQAVVVLDYSGSMGGDYQSGAVQTLTERFLGFAMQIDADGEDGAEASGSDREQSNGSSAAPIDSAGQSGPMGG